MLLACDIGNTTANIGIFNDGELYVKWNITADVHKSPDEYAVILLNLIERAGIDLQDIKHVAICCVAPPLEHVFSELCKRYFNISPLIVEPGVKTGINIRIDSPREVGPDRIVNAVAGHKLFGGPLIVVDLGTATTFDVISERGDYLGGAIAPGIKTAAESLFERTAKLPRVELARPRNAIGHDTVSAMQSGFLFGYVGLIEGLVARIQEELGSKCRVIATGGYADFLARETDIIDTVFPHLSLLGLRLIYELNAGRKRVRR